MSVNGRDVLSKGRRLPDEQPYALVQRRQVSRKPVRPLKFCKAARTGTPIRARAFGSAASWGLASGKPVRLATPDARTPLVGAPSVGFR